MIYLDVLDEIARRGMEILPDGDNLRLRGDLRLLDDELKSRIRTHKAQLLTHIRSRGRSLPVTEMQRAYLLGRTEHCEIGNTASQVYHEIEGAWDVGALERALNTVIGRHPTLRTSFTADGQQIEWQAGELAPCRIAVRDLREAAEGERLAVMATVREAMTGNALPLDRPPLIEAAVSVLDDDRMVLHVRHDGLAVDGISMFILFRDWSEFYRDPGLSKPPLMVTRADYIAALQSPARIREQEAARSYWLERLPSMPAHPKLPLARRPEELRVPGFTRHTAALAAGPWQALKQAAKQAGLTPATLLTAAYAETLTAWGAGRDFTLNLTLADRPPLHPDIFQSIGNFSTVLLLECRSRAEDPFMTRALGLQSQLVRDLEHRHFSGIAVVRELDRLNGDVPARMPFTFNCALGYVDQSLDGSGIDSFGVETYGVTATPQVWLNVFVMERRGALTIEFDAVEGLFPGGMIADIAAAYQRLLETLSSSPDALQSQRFDLMPAAQRERRQQANSTDAPLPAGLLHHEFLARAAERPDATAILTSRGEMSYGELRGRASQVANWLRSHDVRPGELVAVLMPKGWEQIAATLGTLMAGAAYLPIDAALPDARVDWLLRNGEVRCVLTCSGETREPVRAAGHAVLDVSRAGSEATLPGAPATTPDDLAYVIYTSGSTGTPKGVMVTHLSAANLVADINRRFAAGAQDRWFAISQLSFDLSVYDVFGALSAGGALVIPDADRQTDAQHWLDLATGAGATLWNSVPAIVEMLIEQARALDRPLPPSLRLVMMSGDRIPVPLPTAIANLSPRTRVVSLGGPTETTVWNICYPIDRVDPRWVSIPYGKPTANNRYHVLNPELAPCPDWVTGMLYAAGVGLARGYWKDPERTAESFIVHPATGERLYCTGDIGRYLPDGNIEILGRSDFQVKLNGHRVELGEIEVSLASHPQVRAATVTCRVTGDAGKQLVAYVVPAPGVVPRPAIKAVLQTYLGERLPDYMVPRQYVLLDSLPLTANAKVDRQWLARTDPGTQKAVAGGQTHAPEDDLDAAIAGMWRDLLDVETVSPSDNFGNLGGDSLTAARLAGRIRKELGVSIGLSQLMRLETVSAMSAHLRSIQAVPRRGGG